LGLWQRFWAFKPATIAATALVGAFLYDELLTRRIDVEAIEVPPSLANIGWTARTMSFRLAGELQSIRSGAHTTIQGQLVRTGWTMPDIAVPGTGYSLRSVVDFLRPVTRPFIGNRLTRVSGEIVEAASDGGIPRFQLTLRVSDAPALQVGQPRSADELGAALAEGAAMVARRAEPIVLVSYLFEQREQGADTQATALIREVLADEDRDPEMRARAYNFWGLLAFERQSPPDLCEAQRRFEAAVAILSTAHFAYFNLGSIDLWLASAKDARPDSEAARAAIAYERCRPFQYGNISAAEHFRRAAVHFRRAADIVRGNPNYLSHLGRALNASGDRYRAISVLEEARAMLPASRQIDLELIRIYRGGEPTRAELARARAIAETSFLAWPLDTDLAEQRAQLSRE
jgi:hypothetical protein